MAECILINLEEEKPEEENGFSADVLRGLTAFPKSLPCKYIYDDEGDRLWREIIRLPEYYLTKCEVGILKDRGSDIAAHLDGRRFNLIELGPGDGGKADALMAHFKGLDFRFVPIDICEETVRSIVDVPNGVPIKGLVGDYFQGLRWLAGSGSERNLVLFLGSNIGNFEPMEAEGFLRELWSSLNPDDLVLVGFDLVKDIEILERAYNDSRGVTEEFNKNLLHRINRELGGEFHPDMFEYRSVYDCDTQAIKTYLVSLEDQEVYIKDIERRIRFEKGEAIHTESSHKFDPDCIREMAEGNGFEVVADFLDEEGYFADSLWRVIKE